MSHEAPSHSPPAPRTGALAAGTREKYVDVALYDYEYRHRRHDIAFYRDLAGQVARRDGQTATRILELGCGTGRLVIPLARDGHEVFGLDLARPMLRRLWQQVHETRRLNARTRARVHILQGDFRSLPLASGASSGFPLVLCPFNAFMHLYTRQDVERFLAEVRRVLAPEGLFAFDIAHPDPAWLNRDPRRRYARTRFRHPMTGERLVYSTSHEYDPATQLDWVQFFYDPDSDGPDAAQPAERLAGPARQPASATVSDGKQAAEEVPSGASERLPSASTRPGTVIQLTQRLFFPAEIEALLHYNGFELLYHAGGFDGEPLSLVSVEQVICARVR